MAPGAGCVTAGHQGGRAALPGAGRGPRSGCAPDVAGLRLWPALERPAVPDGSACDPAGGGPLHRLSAGGEKAPSQEKAPGWLAGRPGW